LRWSSATVLSGVSTVMFSLTTLSYVSGGVSCIPSPPRISGSVSTAMCRSGVQSFSAFFSPFIAFISPGPGMTTVAAMPPLVSAYPHAWCETAVSWRAITN